MESLNIQEIFTPSSRSRVLEAFGLDKFDIEDTSIHGAAIKEAYFETMDAVTYSQSEDAKSEGITPVKFSAICDTGRLLAGILSRITVAPAVMALPGGGLGLQWNSSNGRIFTVSLFGDGKATFCSIFSDSRRISGMCEVNAIPSGFIPELQDILEYFN